MKQISLIIPTYNEARNLRILVDEIFSSIDKEQIDLEIIFVDDNSPDGTGDIAEQLTKEYQIKAIHRSRKLGLGSAVVEGFKLCNRPYVGVMDADLSHDPTVLNELINWLDKYDLAIASRFAEGSQVVNWSYWRKFLSKVGVYLCQKITGVKDPLSGYFFLKREVIDGINLKTKGYKILFEILVKGRYKKVKELSFQFRQRKYNSSKLNYKEFILFLGQIVSYSYYKIVKK